MKNNQLFKIFGIIALFILTMSLSACGKKQNTLYHTWSGEQYSSKVKYTFYEDKSGLRETEYENGEPDYEKFNWKAYENGFLEIITGDNIWNYDLESYRYSISPNGRTLTLDEYEFSNGLCTLTRVK